MINEGYRQLMDHLIQYGTLPDEEFAELIKFRDAESAEYLSRAARMVAEREYQKKVIFGATVDITNHCRYDCNYCGLRRGNRFLDRYRMNEEQIQKIVIEAYQSGARHLLIQGGDDLQISPDRVAELVYQIKKRMPDMEIMLALGEKGKKTYQLWFHAGARSYFLRQQTADDKYYRQLHPSNMSLLKRKQCLWELKEIGYKVGGGFMVGTPGQKIMHLVQEMTFLRQLSPEYVVIGPFLPVVHTPYEKERSGSVELTCYLLAILRIMLPEIILPISNTMSIMDINSPVHALLSGANMILPDFTPIMQRMDYHCYDRKIYHGKEGAEEIQQKLQKIREAGYEIVGADRL